MFRTVRAVFALLVTLAMMLSAVAARADDEPSTVRVAGIVLKWIRPDKEANFRRAVPMIREAARGGAKIVVTTECFLDGYAIADRSIPLDTYRALGEPIPEGPYFKKLAALADQLDIHLVAGMLEADEVGHVSNVPGTMESCPTYLCADTKRYNTAVLIGPDGKLVGKYRKQRLGHEIERNTPGEKSLVFNTPYGRTGVMICADRRYPDVVGRFFVNGAQFMICPSGGMFGPQKNDPIVQARSRENKTHIVFVHPAEFLVTGPDGKIVQRAILGDRLYVTREDVDSENDSRRVFYFDLPIPNKRDK